MVESVHKVKDEARSHSCVSWREQRELSIVATNLLICAAYEAQLVVHFGLAAGIMHAMKAIVIYHR